VAVEPTFPPGSRVASSAAAIHMLAMPTPTIPSPHDRMTLRRRQSLRAERRLVEPVRTADSPRDGVATDIAPPENDNARAAASPGLRLVPPDSDRFLTTLMFTDLVRSTLTAARLGDSRWCDLLAAHFARTAICARGHCKRATVPSGTIRDYRIGKQTTLPMLSRERKHADRLQEMTTPSPTQHPAGPASRRSSPSSASSTTGSPSCWEPTSAPCMSATASGCRRPWR